MSLSTPAALTRMSHLFLHTLREDPADAEVPSHKLLVRAGYVRRIAPGIFSWLPLGLAVLRKVERIIEQEQNRIGAQLVHFPALLPAEPYEQTGRWEEYGPNLFRLKDRRNNDYLLAPTHEEMFTLLVKSECSSYKELPLMLYQIQHKYRDEARPRAGILRGREFVMKDAYSFDIDDAALEQSYHHQREAYQHTFERLGLDYVMVQAQSGAMGGSASEEFLAPCDSGEDTFVRCTACGYAANVEAFTVAAPDALDASQTPAAHVEDTPDTPTIETLVAAANTGENRRRPDRDWTAADTLKNVVLMLTHPDGTTEPLIVGVPGDRDVDPARLEALVQPATVRAFEPEDFEAHPALVPGYIGPQVLGAESVSKIRYLTDPRVVPGTRWVTGANEPGKHVFDLVAGRDFSSDGIADVADVRVGDPCPTCAAPIQLARGIELGHIFQLGRKYAQALGLQVLDQNGKQVTVTMGSYGIGVTRAVAAIAEQHHDELGLRWPRAVAPFDVHVVAAGKGEEIAQGAADLAQSLTQAGLDTLLDDRNASPGVKFKDAELVGVPTIVVVGRSLAQGNVEVRDRLTGERRDVPLAQAVDVITELAASTPAVS